MGVNQKAARWRVVDSHLWSNFWTAISPLASRRGTGLQSLPTDKPRGGADRRHPQTPADCARNLWSAPERGHNDEEQPRYRRSSARAGLEEVIPPEAVKKDGRIDVQRPRHSHDPGDTGVTVPTLHAGDLADTQAGVVGKLLLGPVTSRTLGLDREANPAKHLGRLIFIHRDKSCEPTGLPTEPLQLASRRIGIAWFRNCRR